MVIIAGCNTVMITAAGYLIKDKVLANTVVVIATGYPMVGQL